MQNDQFAPLMIASQRGHTETARILLNYGADVDMQDRKGWSSLMMASQNGHFELASRGVLTLICETMKDGLL